VAVKLSQGVGVVPWGIGGDLPFPEVHAGTVKGYNSSGQAVSLILDSHSGNFYRIGQKEIWQDKVRSYGQGTNINGMVRAKEHISPDSEESMLEHIESRMVMRPYKESYKGQSGYTNAGFLENHLVQLKMFSNGNTDVPISKLKNVEQYGDYVHGARVEAKRLQHQIETSTAAWRIVRIRQLMLVINKVTPDGVGGVRTENLIQKMFSGQDLWITRDSVKPLMNRATGIEATGVYSSLVTGPDEKSNSALGMITTNLIAYTLSLLAYPSSLTFWIGDLSDQRIEYADDYIIMKVVYGSTCYFEFETSSPAWSESVNLSWDGNDWVFIAITSDGLNFYVYENGVLKGVIPMPAHLSSGYGGAATITCYATLCSVYDIRRIPRQIGPDALQWYYDDVINNNGSGGLLPIMR
jgi:hypothetical protein